VNNDDSIDNDGATMNFTIQNDQGGARGTLLTRIEFRVSDERRARPFPLSTG
jgi:hypothetical protein